MLKNKFLRRGEITVGLSLLAIFVVMAGMLAGKRAIEFGTRLLPRATTTDVNVALNKPVIEHSGEVTPNDPGGWVKMVDGDPATSWLVNALYVRTVVDLQAQYPVSSVSYKLTWATIPNLNSAVIQILGSTNNSTWVQLDRRTISNSGNFVAFNLATPTNYRYIKLYWESFPNNFGAMPWGNIFELEVYAPQPTATPTPTPISSPTCPAGQEKREISPCQDTGTGLRTYNLTDSMYTSSSVNKAYIHARARSAGSSTIQIGYDDTCPPAGATLPSSYTPTLTSFSYLDVSSQVKNSLSQGSQYKKVVIQGAMYYNAELGTDNKLYLCISPPSPTPYYYRCRNAACELVAGDRQVPPYYANCTNAPFGACGICSNLYCLTNADCTAQGGTACSVCVNNYCTSGATPTPTPSRTPTPTPTRTPTPSRTPTPTSPCKQEWENCTASSDCCTNLTCKKDPLDNTLACQKITPTPTRTPTPTPTRTPQQLCESSGYPWKLFPNSCVDSCRLLTPPPPLCLAVFTPGCDCGADKCWNGTLCVNNGATPTPTRTPTPTTPPKYACKTNTDCGCGYDPDTNQCAFLNNQYSSKICTWPDFCGGISGGCYPACSFGRCIQYCPPEATPTPINTCAGEGSSCTWCPECINSTPPCAIACRIGICRNNLCVVPSTTPTPTRTPTPTKTPGTPTPTCAAGRTRCGNNCVNTNTNRNHCGACGNACVSGQSCVAGVCGGTGNSPTPTGQQPTNTPVPGCNRKRDGDADCDDKVNLSDFDYWRREFLGELTTLTADFNNSGNVTVADFEKWRATYTSQVP